MDKAVKRDLYRQLSAVIHTHGIVAVLDALSEACSTCADVADGSNDADDCAMADNFKVAMRLLEDVRDNLADTSPSLDQGLTVLEEIL